MKSHSKVIEDESGIALLVAIVLLLLVSMIGVSALQHSQDEASSSGRTRKRIANLHAADAGIRAAFRQISSSSNGWYTNTNCIFLYLMGQSGSMTMIESREPDEIGCQPFQDLGSKDCSGDALASGGAASYDNKQPKCHLYRANITSSDQAGGQVALQAQFSVRQ